MCLAEMFLFSDMFYMFFEVARQVDNGKKHVHNLDNHFTWFLVQLKYLQQLPIINWLLNTACTYRKRKKQVLII